MRVPLYCEPFKIFQRLPASPCAQLARAFVSPEHLRDFEVQQMGCVQRAAAEDSFFDDRRGSGPQENLEQRRCVNDDHRASRSARNASAGDSDTYTGVRSRTRFNSKSGSGRSVAFLITSSK